MIEFKAQLSVLGLQSSWEAALTIVYVVYV